MKPFKTADTYTADLQRAYDYFKQGGQTAADRFLERHDKAQLSLMDNPLVCRLRPSGWRQWGIPRSTYAIFYRETTALWFFGGVISTVQDPDVIQARLLIQEIRETSPQAE